MIQRKFRGSLTFHKVIMENNMKPSTVRLGSTDNRGGKIERTHKYWHSQCLALKRFKLCQSDGNVGQQSRTKVRSRLDIRNWEQERNTSNSEHIWQQEQKHSDELYGKRETLLSMIAQY